MHSLNPEVKKDPPVGNSPPVAPVGKGLSVGKDQVGKDLPARKRSRIRDELRE